MLRIFKTIVSELKIVLLLAISIIIGIIATAVIKFPFYLLIGILYNKFLYDWFNIENPFDNILAVIFACVFINMFIKKNDSQKEKSKDTEKKTNSSRKDNF